jgi:hypothetical protein
LPIWAPGRASGAAQVTTTSVAASSSRAA